MPGMRKKGLKSKPGDLTCGKCMFGWITEQAKSTNRTKTK